MNNNNSAAKKYEPRENITVHSNRKRALTLKQKMLIQKLMGIALILGNIYAARISGDGTAALVLVPLGIYLTVSRKYLLDI